MGPAYALLFVLAVAASASSLLPRATSADPNARSVINTVCKGTPYPSLCVGTASKHASKYPRVDTFAVLNMQVDAFAKRTAAARGRVAQAAKKTSKAMASALSFCDTMYLNTQDTIGAAERAISFKDKATTRIMLQLAVQDFESCDRPFKQAGMKNPMERFDKSLNKMANNCMALANMI